MENYFINILSLLHKNYKFEDKDFFSQPFISFDSSSAGGARPKFWFEPYKNTPKRFLYKKQQDDSQEAYAEIIGEELATLFQIPCAHYELAEINIKIDDLDDFENSKGVITADFLDEDDILLPIADIISFVLSNYKNFGYVHIDNDGNEIDYKTLYGIDNLNIFHSTQKLNNLEDIWSILDVYIKNHPRFSEWSNEDKKDILFNIIDNLVNIFIYDLITLQGDRHAWNFGLIFNKKKQTFKVAPLYDNSNLCGLNRKNTFKSFQQVLKALDNKFAKPEKIERIKARINSSVYKSQMKFFVSEECLLDYSDKPNITPKHQLENLRYFCAISDIKYIGRIESFIEKIETIGIENILNEIERKRYIIIPQEIKNQTSAMISINIENIKIVLAEYKERRKKI